MGKTTLSDNSCWSRHDLRELAVISVSWILMIRNRQEEIPIDASKRFNGTQIQG